MNLDVDSLGDTGGGEEAGAPPWMATFSDLATLLLTFFVLLLSFAEMDVIEFREMLGSVREAFGTQIDNPGHLEALSSTVVELNEGKQGVIIGLDERETRALQKMKRFVRQRSMQDDVEVSVSQRGVIVRLKERVAFRTGSDELNEQVKPVLDKVAELLNAFPEGLTIEGHTDDRPINTSRFPSNWELSASRATSVLRYMQRDGALDVERLRVAGYADTEPLVPNDSDENRTANRRVEFVFDRSVKRKTRQSFREMLGGQRAEKPGDDMDPEGPTEISFRK